MAEVKARQSTSINLENSMNEIRSEIKERREKVFALKVESKKLSAKCKNLKFEFAMSENVLLSEDYIKTREAIKEHWRSIRVYKALCCEPVSKYSSFLRQ